MAARPWRKCASPDASGGETPQGLEVCCALSAVPNLGGMPHEDLAPQPRRRRGVAQPCRPRRNLSEQADHLHRSVRAGQRHRYDYPGRRPAPRRRAQAKRCRRRSAGREWGARGALCRALGAGRLHLVHEHQQSACGRALFDEERRLRSAEGLRGGHAHGQLHANALRQSRDSGDDGQGADRIRQGKSRQAVGCQRPHTRRACPGDAQALSEVDMLHVPYKSVPPALNDVLAGRVSMMFADLTTALPHVRAGTLRALAVTRLKRSALIPELPTLDEAGVKGFDMDSWAAIFAPAGTPSDIIALLNAELRKIIDSPEVKVNLGNAGFEAFSSSPKELEDFAADQLGKWGKMIKDAGIQPE